MEAVKFYFALKPAACTRLSVKTLSESLVVNLAVQHSAAECISARIGSFTVVCRCICPTVGLELAKNLLVGY